MIARSHCGLPSLRWQRVHARYISAGPPARRCYATWLDAAEKNGRERVVILGSGWAGYVLSKRLDTRKYVPLVISPRSYFVFTPLLNDAAVGTLELRTVLEPVRRKNSGVSFLQGWADDINLADKTVTCEPSVLDPDVGHALTGERQGNQSLQPKGQKAPTFKLHYDKLIVAVGCYSQTFGTKGVKENALFLKDVGDARRIRRRILDIFELAALPTTTERVRNSLLHFAVVGGGPTGMEFAAQLCDLVQQDLSKLYPGLTDHVRISLYDVAPKVLPMFDASLADYAVRNYRRQGIEIKTSHHVEELRQGFPNESTSTTTNSNTTTLPYQQHKTQGGGVYTLRTTEEGDIGIGMCVWSTGNMMNPFVRKALDTVHRYPTHSAEITSGETDQADQEAQWHMRQDDGKGKGKTGSILVDDRLRIQIETASKNRRAHLKDVWCIGDVSRLASGPLPATAQVANQQAIWLAKHLNHQPTNNTATTTTTTSTSSTTSTTTPKNQPFTFKDLGVMAYIGDAKALFQQGGGASSSSSNHPQGQSQNQPQARRSLKGGLAFLLWRGAYLTMTLSWRNKIMVPMYWLVNRLFGRDITRF